MSGAFLIADLPGMLQTTEFAESALVTSGEFAGDTVVGVLDNPASDALGVLTSTPVFVAASTPALAQGDTIEILDRDYRIQEPEPDDTGVTRYPLTEV